MSFIKVKDPRKREELIRDFIETRKRIKDNFIARKVGESEYQTGLTKLFKPVTETQKATTEKFTQELLPIKEGIEELPTKLFRKVFPSIELKASDIMNLGPFAVNALLQAFTKKNIDLSFGLYAQNGKFKIGSKEVNIEDNDIKIDDIIFEGTPGFWELVTSKDPNPENYTEEDLDKYQQLVILTNTAFRGNDPNSNKPKSSGSPKWKKIIKPIWEQIKKQKEEEYKEFEDEDEDDPQPSTSGTGLKILPSDPNALIDRFDLLFSSKKAGHTGVRNEIVSILDELKRQGVLKTNEYKKLNSLIKKMIVPKQGFKRQYAFGGTGIFDTIGNIIKGVVTSQAGKDLAKFALDTSKNIAKTTATNVGNRLVKKVLTPKSKSIITKHTRALNPDEAVKINELVKMLNQGMGIKKL